MFILIAMALCIWWVQHTYWDQQMAVAIRSGDITMARIALQNHANPNAQMVISDEPLIERVRNAIYELRYHQEPERHNGSVPIIEIACFDENLPMIELLLSFGSKLDCTPWDSSTLDSCISLRKTKSAELLLRHGALTGKSFEAKRVTMCNAIRINDSKLANSIIQVSYPNQELRTLPVDPIFDCAESGSVQMAELLLKHGSSVTSRYKGELPCEVANRSQNYTVLSYLVKHGGGKTD